jgi:hypothetical protein
MEKYIHDNNYIIYSDGTVYSVKRKKFLKPQKNWKGYLMVNISGKLQSLHRLIAKIFIPNPDNFPQVNHINEIKTDNRIENLEWITCRSNIEHSNKSKYPGTTFCKTRNKFIAQITHNNKCINLGGYKTQEEAHQAYINYRIIHNI